MLSNYCLKCRKNTESKTLKTAKIARIMLLSKCAVMIVKNWNLLKIKKLVD